MVAARDEDFSSDSESDTPAVSTPATNGANGSAKMTNGLTMNGKEKAAEELSPAEVGMRCGLKHLYSGKEDKKGRFQWQDSIPEDLGDPAEDAETAKWALLVRQVKVYNDPRKVLAIHSIVVQSPLLKKLLGHVLKDYPGVTVGLQRLEFSGKFEPLIHRWTELTEAIAKLGESSEDERQTKEHAELLQQLLQTEFKSLTEASQDMKSKGVMTYEHLWTLFQPGALIYTRQDGHETVIKLQETRYGQDNCGNPCFWLICKYNDWDGTKFGTVKLNLKIYPYTGTRAIVSLTAFPLDFHRHKDDLTARLIERGSKAEALAGSNYKGYHGIGWMYGQFGTKDKYNIKGRIVIDTYGWNRFNPNYAIHVAALSQKEVVATTDDCDDSEDCEEYEEEYDEDEGDMPSDGHFADEDDQHRRPPLTDEQKLMLTPLLRGYSLKTKQWLNFFVNCVQEIDWMEGAFDSLVLPANQKELILGFTESQRKYKGSFDDVIEGKGKGIILLLCGPPGVGKTLTAESVAEEMRVPLYMMSAGDLGLDPRNVESKLQNILEMCTRWDAILLLDEADVFLEQRSLHELERNKLVSIFLRILEYYEGIMFLTTNRVQTFDPAFQSRIHISLDYPELSIESRRTVWKNFLQAHDASLAATTGRKHRITDRQLDSLALMNMNGRQIKNVLKTAQLLASRKEADLKHEHVMIVLDVTQHLHNSTRENERTRSSIFC
ncbi:hypothetical protein H2201_003521 [Coniosporium apollinis]|uniref:AAA+ ATPase domain-containing protein n=2 Tax=Coniosporium TaxID=2810619 RepID=A0ABQ9NX55_9PEZI|nr:hypothetical protein H2199_008031 [Cladosporium sp. JES 115]KAJ9666333.1 hypothetical protein H2201_003521 [Coniosporium apollinis]